MNILRKLNQEDDAIVYGYDSGSSTNDSGSGSGDTVASYCQNCSLGQCENSCGGSCVSSCFLSCKGTGIITVA